MQIWLITRANRAELREVEARVYPVVLIVTNGMAALVLSNSQDNIPGVSLAGKEPQALECEELRFLAILLKGLKTKAALKIEWPQYTRTVNL